MWGVSGMTIWDAISRGHCVRVKLWSLPAPPEGREWHRTDWTEKMLPKGWRPLLLNEQRDKADEVYGMWNTGPWTRYGEMNTADSFARDASNYTRTQRPLPTPPTLRPWTKPSDIPWPVCWLRRIGDDSLHCMVVSVSITGVQIAMGDGVTFAAWSNAKRWEQLEYSTDRKTWSPCGVMEEGK